MGNGSKPVVKRWHDKTIQFDKGNTRWLGHHLDRCLNWHAHVDTCVQRALWKQQQVRRFMDGHGINRMLARTVSWSTSMATATYGLDVIYEGQQWIVDQIQKVAGRIAKDAGGLRATTPGGEAIRSPDIPTTRAMLDRRTEQHFMRMKQQQVRRFMAAPGINRNLARTVAWSTAMATATYVIEVMYEGQQWIVDQIQKVNVKIAKNIAGLKSTTVGCDAIRHTDTPPTRAMLDRRTERHFIRLLTRKNSYSDLIPDEPDGMVDEEDMPTLDSWTERTAEDLWVLGDDFEQSFPVDLEFGSWHEEKLIGRHGNHIDEYHGWTDGSRRVSAAFGWSLRGYND
jgi:hypothetical protein